MKKNIGKSRLHFCLLSLVLVTGIFNVKLVAEGPGCMPTGGTCPALTGHPMATPSVGGAVFASLLNTTVFPPATGQTPLGTRVFNVKLVAEGPGCMPTGGTCPGLIDHPMGAPSTGRVIA